MVVIQMTPAPELEAGQKFLVLGNGISTGTAGDPGEYFFVETKTGRPWVPPAATASATRVPSTDTRS